ncbi:MAG TPA: hypothetical protein VE984_04460 [Gaiellaceae bacterium]|nr:hypothetical protein [Gaiellaceae bacterium]
MRLALMIEGQEGVTWSDWCALADACEEHGVETLAGDVPRPGAARERDRLPRRREAPVRLIGRELAPALAA